VVDGHGVSWGLGAGREFVQRLPVRIRFNPDQDPQHLLRPGMSVEPQVNVRDRYRTGEGQFIKVH